MKTPGDHSVTIVGAFPHGYKFRGEFHTGEACQPIKDDKGTLVGITKPRRIVHVHSHGGEAPFFQAISEQGRLLATRCTNPGCPGNGTVYLPFRICCPDCLKRMQVLDVTDRAISSAKVYTFIVTSRTGAFNTMETPIRFVDIEFPFAATFLKGYLVGPGEPSIGLRVIPVFRTGSPTYTIKDLAWVVESTRVEDLPKGFAFASKTPYPAAEILR